MEKDENAVSLPQGSQRTRLQGSGAPNPQGEFEILAITAGTGNGWHFSAGALQASLALWDGVQCFVDHAWNGHSVRDLAGVCCSPQWEETSQGVRLTLKPLGPSAELLRELGRQVLAEEGGAGRVGFSADVLFTAQGRQVEQILRVFSLDLVIDPARGGAFLRALNQLQFNQTFLKEEINMPEATNQPAAAQSAVQEPERTELCARLLESSLAASRLPAAAGDAIRKQFAGRSFDPAELDSAVESARQMVSDLTGSLTVQGAGRVQAVFSAEDQLNAAVHDLLGAERPAELNSLKTQRLSGIRELYTLTTGDISFVGGFDAERAQLAATADLPGLLKNAFNKLVLMQWQELGRAGYRWWESVVSVEHFNSLHPLTGVLVGEVNLLPAVNEGAAYTELDVSDSAETGAWGKYGGYVGLTLEMFERDETHKLRQYPLKLASAALRRISALVAAVFTANAGAGPTLADGGALFNDDAVSVSGGHANLRTAALSGAEWEAVSSAVYAQPMLTASGGTAPCLALDPKYLLVPRPLRLAAMRILYPSWEREANIVAENLQRGELGDVITVPEWTDANNWAAVCDPRLAPGIIVGERFGLMPEIFVADSNQHSSALFTNDELRIKVRHWVSVFVADYRPLHKNNVA